MCAYAAQAVYKDEPGAQQTIHTKYKLAGHEYVTIERDNSHCAMFLISDDTLVLSFAGTDDFEDVREFFEMGSEKDEICGGRIHGGFRDSIDELWLGVMDELYHERFSSVNNVVCTGHSLGASLATIAAGRIKKMMPLYKVRLYTFGSPRTGNRDFRDSINSMIVHWRFVNNNDIVTELPPVLNHYHHCGEMHYITAFGKIRTDVGKWILFRDRVVGFFHSLIRFSFDPLQDHRIDKYVKLLEGNKLP